MQDEYLLFRQACIGEGESVLNKNTAYSSDSDQFDASWAFYFYENVAPEIVSRAHSILKPFNLKERRKYNLVMQQLVDEYNEMRANLKRVRPLSFSRWFYHTVFGYSMWKAPEF